MIILINNQLDLTNDAQGKIRAIENILIAHGECRHVVWMPVDIIQNLINQKRLGEYSQRILYELKSFSLEARGIENAFNFHVEVDFNNGTALENINNKINIGYKHFINSMSLKKSMLLAENLRDAEIFSLGAEAFLFNEKLYRSYTISLENISGGGSTTYDAFVKLEKEENFFACIIDSDLKHPNGPIGSTAKRFSHIAQGLSGKRLLRILNCHEVENIIPLAVVKEATNGTIEDSLIFRLGKINPDRAHPDHKSGLSVTQARELDEKHGSDYWQDYYPHENNGRSWIVPPLGENLLSNCLQLMLKCSVEKLAEYISPELDALWLQTSQDVASWGVAMKRAIH